MPRNSANDDNRANQLNPNNDAYWQSRGYEDRDDAYRVEDDDADDEEEQATESQPTTGSQTNEGY